MKKFATLQIVLLALIPALFLSGCQTTETTTTNPDGSVVTVRMRRTDYKTLRILAQTGGQVLSAAAAAELNRRAEEAQRR